MKKSYIWMHGGVIQGWQIPKGHKIILKDYDIVEEHEGVKTDEDGDQYEEIILEGEG